MIEDLGWLSGCKGLQHLYCAKNALKEVCFCIAVLA